MTQNKKKGIAKKALSISLVAAMLATSNVPAWASGFEAVDPTAEGVALEESIENTDNTTMKSNDIVTEADLNVDLSVDKTSAVWDDDADAEFTITGKIENKYTSDPVGLWNYAWKDNEKNVVEGKISSGKVEEMSLNATKELAGKTLTLWIWRSETAVDFNINTGITVTIEKKALKSVTLNAATPEYNGFQQSLSTANVTVEADGDFVLDANEYTVNANSAVNAGDELTITAKANDDSAYIGSVTSDPVKIDKKTYEDGDIIPSVTEGLTYQYTGKPIEIAKDKVTLKESLSEDKGADGKLRGDDLSSTITKAVTEAGTVGKQKVMVYFDGSKIKNIGVAENSNLSTKENVTIEKRDLKNNCTISWKYGEVATGSPVSEVIGDLVFKDGDTVLDLKNGVDFTVKITDKAGSVITGTIPTSGTYTVAITATADGNAINGQTISLNAVGNVVTGVTVSKAFAPEYTGAEIKPTQDDLGVLTVSGTANNDTLEADDWKIVGYDNNINASNTTSNPKMAAVKIEILDGTYAGKTAVYNFSIGQLKVTATDITVPKAVSYNKAYKEAKEYQIPATVVAKDSKDNKITLKESDYTLSYAYSDATNKNNIGNNIVTTVTITNDNYKKDYTAPIEAATKTKIVAKALTDAMIHVNPASYVYTGANIIPEFAVIDGSIVLYEDEEYTAQITDNVKVGNGKITITGDDRNYSGTASATFAITPADVTSVKAKIDDIEYTGKQIRPRMTDIEVTLNGNNVSSQFEVKDYGENVKAGVGTVILKPVDGNKNFSGDSVTVEFNIVQDKVDATLNIYNEYGTDITNNAAAKIFTFDGTEKTFAKALLNNITIEGSTKKVDADNFEIKYADNVSGKYSKDGNNKAYIYAVAKDGSGYTGNESFTTADGTTIKGVVDYIEFVITSVKFAPSNVTVKKAYYAGGIPVKPEVLVQIGGNTLVEGKDYKVVLDGYYTEVTNGNTLNVTIEGLGGYAGSKAENLKWGIDKKNLKDCIVTAENGVVVVMNGAVPVPTTEYTVTDNENGSTTVTAKAASKNYTGSTTVYGIKAPEATTLKVTNRTDSSVSLAWDKVENAEGYTVWFRSEYDSKVSRQILHGSDTTSWKQVGLQPGTKYFYTIKAWVKNANGEYVFSEQSPVQRGTTKPLAAVIKSVSATNGKVKVALAGKAAGAEMYSMCYSKTADGFTSDNFKVGIRTSYTTRTFSKALTAGTYYVRVKSYRDLGNSKRVYGAWSNTMKVVVK